MVHPLVTFFLLLFTKNSSMILYDFFHSISYWSLAERGDGTNYLTELMNDFYFLSIRVKATSSP